MRKTWRWAAALGVLNEPSSWPKRILFWLSVVTLGYFFYTWQRLPDRSPLGGILGLVGLAILVLFVKYGAPFLSARTFVKKNPDKLGPAKHSIGPDGTFNESSHGEGTAKWTAYLRIRETPRFFLRTPSRILHRFCQNGALTAPPKSKGTGNP